jgi:hypothetical protein
MMHENVSQIIRTTHARCEIDGLTLQRRLHIAHHQPPMSAPQIITASVMIPHNLRTRQLLQNNLLVAIKQFALVIDL